jgi:hypothetical protein
MIFKNSVRTAKKTQVFTITKTNLLMLFKEIIAVYSENHTKHINTKCRVKGGSHGVVDQARTRPKGPEFVLTTEWELVVVAQLVVYDLEDSGRNHSDMLE